MAVKRPPRPYKITWREGFLWETRRPPERPGGPDSDDEVVGVAAEGRAHLLREVVDEVRPHVVDVDVQADRHLGPSRIVEPLLMHWESKAVTRNYQWLGRNHRGATRD